MSRKKIIFFRFAEKILKTPLKYIQNVFFVSMHIDIFWKKTKKNRHNGKKYCTIYPKGIFNELSRTNKTSRSFDMAIKDTYKHMRDLLAHITQDLSKAEGGNKAASQRVRTGTVKLEKVAKLYRKESIKTERTSGGSKKTAKKAAHKPAHKAAHKAAKKTAHAKPKAKAKAHKAVARPRAMSFKRPSAKLPMRRAFR
jgi:hypothetical protein